MLMDRHASDEEILTAAAESARRGFAIESSSAASLACAAQMAASSGDEQTWIVIASGAGIKWPSELLSSFSSRRETTRNNPIPV